MAEPPATRKVFWEDPYRTTLDTRIRAVDGADVTLAETIFYAFSGGQESDAGSIGGHAVHAARKLGRDILYTLDPGHGLKPGDPVRVEIDWARRYRLMRLHFAAELTLEIVCRRLPAAGKIGAHIAADKARIDFAYPEPVTPLLPEIAAEANAVVTANLEIESTYSDEAAQRRFWKIEGFASVPCGGTHLKRTGEVGAIALKRRNVGKGKERIEILLVETA